jgi:hypothetical protein
MIRKIGLNVVAISVDNFSANRKFFDKELCKGEVKQCVINSDGSKTFMTIGSVHNIKNTYNNFLNRKKFQCPDFRGEKIGNPDFHHIEQVYDLELGKPVKIAYKLS